MRLTPDQMEGLHHELERAHIRTFSIPSQATAEEVAGISERIEELIRDARTAR